MAQTEAQSALKALQKEGKILQDSKLQVTKAQNLEFRNCSNIPSTSSLRLLIKLNNGCYYYGFVNNSLAEDQQGIVIFSDGAYYMGQVIKGKQNGKGSLLKISFDGKEIMYSYEGCWKDGKPHGFGKQIIRDSSIYEGSFVNGKKNGHGKLIYKDQTEYQGEFVENRCEGMGTYSTKSHIWKGIWVDGYLDGQGQQTSLCSQELWDQSSQGESVYRGGFIRGLKQGKGGITWKLLGAEYNGSFDNGQLNGEGVFKLNDTKYVGLWKRGMEVKLDSAPPSQITFKKMNLTINTENLDHP